MKGQWTMFSFCQGKCSSTNCLFNIQILLWPCLSSHGCKACLKTSSFRTILPEWKLVTNGLSRPMTLYCSLLSLLRCNTCNRVNNRSIFSSTSPSLLLDLEDIRFPPSQCISSPTLPRKTLLKLLSIIFGCSLISVKCNDIAHDHCVGFFHF